LALERQEVKEQIRAAADIVEVIGAYVPLKRAGSRFKALCPFHNEKTPSFFVNPERQIYKCFGCGEAGDVFRFIQMYEKVSFPEAVSILAAKYGIKLPQRRPAGQRRQAKIEKNALYKINQLAAEFYHACLESDPSGKARKYLSRRGISEDSTESFQLGYAPESWDGFLKVAQKKGLNEKELLAAGLIIEKREAADFYDRFRDRLIFPIFDTQGRVIGFGARLLSDAEDGPKYINSPETEVFSKGRCFYALDKARRSVSMEKDAVVVEGYTDCIMAHQSGITNVVATLGTALTHEHLRLLRRYAPRATLVFDGDEAGQRAADRNLELFLEENLEVRIAILPAGSDPCSYIVDEGADAFREKMRSALEVFDYKISRVEKSILGASAAAKAQAAEGLLETVGRCSEPLKKNILLKLLAERLDLPEALLRKRMKRPRSSPGEATVSAVTFGGAFEIAQKDLIECLLNVPSLVDEAREGVKRELLSARERGICEAIYSLYDRSRPIDLDALFDALEDGEAVKLVAGLVDTSKNETALRNQFRMTLAYFRNLEKKKRLEELQCEFKEARRKGNEELADELWKELSALRMNDEGRGKAATGEKVSM